MALATLFGAGIYGSFLRSTVEQHRHTDAFVRQNNMSEPILVGICSMLIRGSCFLMEHLGSAMWSGTNPLRLTLLNQELR